MGEEGSSSKPDFGVLSAEQQEKLRRFKIETRQDNEKYLRAHPEIQEMIGELLRKLIINRPTNILEFAADHFTNFNTPAGPSEESSKDLE